jgi:hypothetical protein
MFFETSDENLIADHSKDYMKNGDTQESSTEEFEDDVASEACTIENSINSQFECKYLFFRKSCDSQKSWVIAIAEEGWWAKEGSYDANCIPWSRANVAQMVTPT